MLAVATLVLLAPGRLPAGEPRTWTSADGSRTVEAEFVSARGDQVTLRMTGGRVQRYDLEKFSEADRRWVEERLAEGENEAGKSGAGGALAGLVTGEWERHEAHGLRFRLHGDRSLLSGDGAGHPLVVYLHGRGGNVMDPERPGQADRFTTAENRGERGCFVLVPQCPAEQFWNAHAGSVVSIIRDLVRELPVDGKRIYLTGYSMGAYGTFHLLAAEPRLFAAAVPVAGGGAPARTRAYRRVPLWVFHGARDEVVPVEQSRAMVEALERQRGRVRYTEIPDGGHGIGPAVYGDPEVHAWLFAQSRD